MMTVMGLPKMLFHLNGYTQKKRVTGDIQISLTLEICLFNNSCIYLLYIYYVVNDAYY